MFSVHTQDLSRWGGEPSGLESALRLGLAVVLLAAGFTAPTAHHGELGLYIALALALAAVWRTPARATLRYLRRAALFLAVFTVLLLVFNWRKPYQVVEVWGARVALSAHGLAFAAAAVERAVLAVLVGGTLYLTLGPSGILAGVETWRVPHSAATILFLIFRYAGVLVGEAGRIQTARRSRQVGSRWVRFGTLAQMSQRFLLRTYDRAERVYLAMCARGFDGRVPVLADAPARRLTWAIGGVTVGLIVLAKLWPVLRAAAA